jgi:FKBP-type peptidyl-prolyl cis-trans isomerase FklB
MKKMKSSALVLGALMISVFGASAENSALIGANTNQPIAHKDSPARISYAMGVDLARNFNKQQMDLDVDQFTKGLRDGLTGQKVAMSELEIEQCLNFMQTEIRQRQAKLHGMKTPEINKKRAEDYLTENKSKAGVQVLKSGIQYRIIKAGSGRKPTSSDTVVCAYRATLINGKEIATTGPGQTVAFKVSEPHIRGWSEVLPLMPAGSKFQIILPPQYAYGLQGVPGKIAANELIISELEVVNVK